MGAWSSLKITASTLRGLAPNDFDENAVVDDQVTAQARTTVKNVVVPMVAGFVAQYGSAEAFFDAATAKTELATELQTLLGLAYLYHLFLDRASAPGNVYFERAITYYNPDRARGLLIDAAKAFAVMVPVVLGQTTRPTLASGASLASTMSRYDRRTVTITSN